MASGDNQIPPERPPKKRLENLVRKSNPSGSKETARELEIDETGEDFDRAMDRILRPEKP